MNTPTVEEHEIEAAPVASTSFLARLIRWYRDAVIEPSTEQEESEWRENSF